MASMLMNSLRSGPVTSVQAARFGKTARVSAELMNTSFYAASEKILKMCMSLLLIKTV